MAKRAEAFLSEADDAGSPIRHLVHDKDFKYSKRFDVTLEKEGLAVTPTAPHAPNQNAFIERWIGSIKHECLNRFIAFRRAHLDHLVAEYAAYYNELRPHQRKDNKPLRGRWPEVDDPPGDHEEITCRERLGGVLKHYERVAA